MAVTRAEVTIPRRASLLAKLIGFFVFLLALSAFGLGIAGWVTGLVNLILLFYAGGGGSVLLAAHLAGLILLHVLGLLLNLVVLRSAGGVFFEESRKWCSWLGGSLLCSSAAAGIYHLLTRWLLAGLPVMLWFAGGCAVLGLFYISPLALTRPVRAQPRPGES